MGDRIAEVQAQQKAQWEAEQRCPVRVCDCVHRMRQTPDNLLGCGIYNLDNVADEENGCIDYMRKMQAS